MWKVVKMGLTARRQLERDWIPVKSRENCYDTDLKQYVQNFGINMSFLAHSDVVFTNEVHVAHWMAVKTGPNLSDQLTEPITQRSRLFTLLILAACPK